MGFLVIYCYFNGDLMFYIMMVKYVSVGGRVLLYFFKMKFLIKLYMYMFYYRLFYYRVYEYIG